MPTDHSSPSRGLGAGPVPILPDRALVAFLHRFDHDLRTPLGTMTAAVELLRDEGVRPDTRTESIAVLERQIARLHALAETLRDFSRSLASRSGDAPDR